MKILEYLQKNSIDISADCGGNGTCGKCLVRIEGRPGLHKACETEYENGMRITVVNSGGPMSILGGDVLTGGQKQGVSEYYGVAVDIGTTTIAAVIIESAAGRVITGVTAMNSCRAFGADVISRIKYASEGHAKEMSLLMRKDLDNIIGELVLASGISKITNVSISANTTMVHLLLGYDVTGLGKYPYTPVNLSMAEGNYYEMFGSGLEFMRDVKVYIMPGASAFIGGDIVSGLYYLGMPDNDDICGFLDLGTNGEMAVCHRGRIMAASASAGPVFEGASVSCGTGSISGAICHVQIFGRRDIRISTVGNRPPVGICGTGVIETVSEMLRNGAVDSAGLMDPGWCRSSTGVSEIEIARRTDGSCITFSQKDVRQFQLAKAAIRTAFEILLSESGIEASDISKMYLAGGFGYNIDCSAAAKTGMLPDDIRYRMCAAGNTSLMGAAKMITGDIDENIGKVSSLAGSLIVSELAADSSFEKNYISYLNF